MWMGSLLGVMEYSVKLPKWTSHIWVSMSGILSSLITHVFSWIPAQRNMEGTILLHHIPSLEPFFRQLVVSRLFTPVDLWDDALSWVFDFHQGLSHHIKFIWGGCMINDNLPSSNSFVFTLKDCWWWCPAHFLWSHPSLKGCFQWFQCHHHGCWF